MSQSTVIDTTATVTPEQPAPPQNNTMALQRSEAGAVSAKPMTVEELHDRLEFVRRAMQSEMKEGQDYGKIPGAGEKPSLLQPGAQKLLMLFNLTVQVKKEVLREFPGLSVGMHREYEFTLTIQAPNGKSWDGVGTCSTLEKKYRYRKGKRVCPECHQETIILGKAEFGGGWICWKTKGGCGAKFEGNDARISGQSVEDVENEDPAECWNTVRKMAYKRALVHGSINATNTSELWTQDVEDMDLGGGADKKKAPAAAAKAKQPPRGKPPLQQTPPATASKPPVVIYPSEATRVKLIETLDKSDLHAVAREYFRKLVVPPSKSACLLPTEGLEHLPLQFVPVTTRQMWELNNAIRSFADGHEIKAAFPPNPLKPEEKPPAKAKEDPKKTEPAKAPAAAKPVEVPRDKNPDPSSPDAPWRAFPIPFGAHAGCTLGEVGAKVLFGFWANFKVEEFWVDRNGQRRQSKPEKIAKDRVFRAMLDEAGKHYEFTNPDAEPGDEEPEEPSGAAAARSEAEDGQPDPSDDDVPF